MTMNWHQNLMVIDGRIYIGDRWASTFSSHSAAMAGIAVMRKGSSDVEMTEDDRDLLAAIDADEV
jgi:hypothetical protein